MRMRKKKHGAERLAANANYLLSVPETPIQSSQDIFKNNNPLHLEIGCGKGAFACGMAKEYPNVNFIAFEKVHDVMVIATENAERRKEERSEDNLRFVLGDAKDLLTWFAPSSLDTIYMNFSDPWPKKRHAKRRLTHRDMITLYSSLVKEGGHIYFKTDNRPLFDFSLEELEALHIKPDFITYDLHHSEWNEKNIRTEYENNFSAKGFSINAYGITVTHKGENHEKTE